jgi:hypothetical protein
VAAINCCDSHYNRGIVDPEETMRVLLGFVIAAIFLTPLPLHAQALDANAIKANFFNGQPFIASSPTRQRYTMVFTPDGKATREPLGKAGDKVDGKWKVVKEGFCTQWKDGPFNCYRLVPSTIAEGKWAVMKGATTVASWSRQQP